MSVLAFPGPWEQLRIFLPTFNLTDQAGGGILRAQALRQREGHHMKNQMRLLGGMIFGLGAMVGPVSAALVAHVNVPVWVFYSNGTTPGAGAAVMIKSAAGSAASVQADSSGRATLVFNFNAGVKSGLIAITAKIGGQSVLVNRTISRYTRILDVVTLVVPQAAPVAWGPVIPVSCLTFTSHTVNGASIIDPLPGVLLTITTSNSHILALNSPQTTGADGLATLNFQIQVGAGNQTHGVKASLNGYFNAYASVPPATQSTCKIGLVPLP